MDFAARFARRGVVFTKRRVAADGDLADLFGRDDLLKEAGLRKPTFYQAAEAMRPGLTGYPLTLEQFTKWVTKTVPGR